MAPLIGHDAVPAKLLEVKADVNARNKDDNTPLHMASFIGHVGVTADIPGDSDVKARNRETSWLNQAAREGYLEVTEFHGKAPGQELLISEAPQKSSSAVGDPSIIYNFTEQQGHYEAVNTTVTLAVVGQVGKRGRGSWIKDALPLTPTEMLLVISKVIGCKG